MVSPVIVVLVAVPQSVVVVCATPAMYGVITYPVTADAPVADGAVQERFSKPLPRVPMATPVGAPGSPGVTDPELAVAPAPTALMPATVKLYVWPLARFGTVNGDVSPTSMLCSSTLPDVVCRYGVMA